MNAVDGGVSIYTSVPPLVTARVDCPPAVAKLDSLSVGAPNPLRVLEVLVTAREPSVFWLLDQRKDESEKLSGTEG